MSKIYADNRLLEYVDLVLLQKGLDEIIALFAYAGLNPNTKKTKYIVIRGETASQALREEYMTI